MICILRRIWSRPYHPIKRRAFCSNQLVCSRWVCQDLFKLLILSQCGANTLNTFFYTYRHSSYICGQYKVMVNHVSLLEQHVKITCSNMYHIKYEHPTQNQFSFSQCVRRTNYLFHFRCVCTHGNSPIILLSKKGMSHYPCTFNFFNYIHFLSGNLRSSPIEGGSEGSF